MADETSVLGQDPFAAGASGTPPATLASLMAMIPSGGGAAAGAAPTVPPTGAPPTGPMGLPTGGGILGGLFQGPNQLPPQAAQAILSGISNPPSAGAVDPMAAQNMALMQQGQQEIGTQYGLQHQLMDRYLNALSQMGKTKQEWTPTMVGLHHQDAQGNVSVGKNLLHDIGAALAMAGLATKYGQAAEGARFAGARRHERELAEQADTALKGMQAQAPAFGAAGGETWRPGMVQARQMSAAGQLMKDQTYAAVQPALERVKQQIADDQDLKTRLQHGDKQAQMQVDMMIEQARDSTMRSVAGMYTNATERGQEVSYAQNYWDEQMAHPYQTFIGTAPPMPAIPPRTPGAAPPAAPGAGRPAVPPAGTPQRRSTDKKGAAAGKGTPAGPPAGAVGTVPWGDGTTHYYDINHKDLGEVPKQQ